MPNHINYKGYIIDPKPIQLQEPEHWTIRVLIMRDTGQALKYQEFSGYNKKCKNEAEAVNRSLAFGMLIVNGEIPGCSVKDEESGTRLD